MSEPSRTAPRRCSSDFSIEKILAKDSTPSVATSTPSQSCYSSCSKATRACGSFLEPGTTAASDEKDKLDWIADCGEIRGTTNRVQDKLESNILETSKETTKQTNHKNLEHFNGEELSWLRCTRYCPPKLPRKSCAGKNFKRKPGSHPRIPFTKYQIDLLEEKYKSSPYLSRKDVLCLSELLQLPQSRIKIWFQNRRARARRESQLLDQTHAARI